MVLRISPEQMTAMRRIWVSPLVDELLGELGVRHAKRLESLGPERCRRLLTDAIGTARRHDLEGPTHLRAYAALVVTIGEDLGRAQFMPWAGPVLDDPWLNGFERIHQLEELAIEHGLIAP